MMKIQRSAKRQTTVATGSLPCAANIAQFELANGVRIFVYENFNSPAVVINGYLLSGSLDETRENAGLAGFVSDCLMRGTKQFSYEQIFEQTEAIGAGLNVSSGMYTTSFSGKSLVEDLPFMMSCKSARTTPAHGVG
jgi:predicted Zn-dependent peptidase